MKKTLIASSLGLSMISIGQSALALDITPSGFVDMVWTLSDGTDLGYYGAEGAFDTSGELDVETNLKEGISMRFDADINPVSSVNNDSARLEQIFLNWNIDEKMSLKGGVFNNNLTWEMNDAPDMYQITHGQLWQIWDSTTVETQNNIQGLQFTYKINKVTLEAAYLNDLLNTPDENSVKIAGGMQVTPDFSFMAGLITQDTGVENIIDVHATWKKDKLLIGGELLFAQELVDTGFMVMANYQFMEKLSGTARFDWVSYDSAFLAEDTTSLTIAALYSISSNLSANAEIRFNDNGNPQPPGSLQPQGANEGDGTTARVELLATF